MPRPSSASGRRSCPSSSAPMAESARAKRPGQRRQSFSAGPGGIRRDADAYYAVPKCLGKEGRVRQGHRRYNQALAINPDSPKPMRRGFAWNDKGEHDKAIADCNQALALIPNRRRLQHSRPGMARKRRVRQGHRRLQPGPGDRSQNRRSLQQPRLGMEGKGRIRQGPCRLQPGPGAQSQIRKTPTTFAARVWSDKGE